MCSIGTSRSSGRRENNEETSSVRSPGIAALATLCVALALPESAVFGAGGPIDKKPYADRDHWPRERRHSPGVIPVCRLKDFANAVTDLYPAAAATALISASLELNRVAAALIRRRVK